MGYGEQIVFKDGEFQIQRELREGLKKTYKYFPLSIWKFEKLVKAQALVTREIPSVDLDNPTRQLFYVIDIEFMVDQNNPLSKHIYLKTEKRKIENKGEFLQVYIRDLETNQTVVASYQNLEYPPFSFVRITRSKPRRIKSEELNEIIKSGNCLGVFLEKELSRRTV